MGPRKDLREIFTVKKRKNQRWEKIQVRTPNRTWTALNQGSVQSSAKWLNRTCGPVLGSPKKAENRTEPDFCNPTRKNEPARLRRNLDVPSCQVLCSVSA